MTRRKLGLIAIVRPRAGKACFYLHDNAATNTTLWLCWPADTCTSHSPSPSYIPCHHRCSSHRLRSAHCSCHSAAESHRWVLPWYTKLSGVRMDSQASLVYPEGRGACSHYLGQRAFPSQHIVSDSPNVLGEGEDWPLLYYFATQVERVYK